MRSFNSGPAGTLMMLIGVLLAASSTWTAIFRARWPEALPSILIGLSLTAVGYSLFARSRRTRADPPEGES
ncbi:hypothetical protein ACFO1B_47360 [Dactylosporangium siamense]|uniref:Uncharacterized protein n=1 Tax=Dactylosporangium siamense TaxID=685454 RepID=A0A919PT96_9ACTN|nr:hypothetical protein [Dactylosporangium siamense]GIG50445.1 hypothetical protein Dsi01nite_084860 [Dactylosporangium siamense]